MQLRTRRMHRRLHRSTEMRFLLVNPTCGSYRISISLTLRSVSKVLLSGVDRGWGNGVNWRELWQVRTCVPAKYVSKVKTKNEKILPLEWLLFGVRIGGLNLHRYTNRSLLVSLLAALRCCTAFATPHPRHNVLILVSCQRLTRSDTDTYKHEYARWHENTK